MRWSFDDIETMRRIAAHDSEAFKSLYQQYGKAVYSLAYRILNNSTLAEEVTQDTFLKIWQQNTHWDSQKGKLINWLLTITQFTAIDRVRQEKRQPQLHPNPIDEMDESSLMPRHETWWQEGTVIRDLIVHLPAEQANLIDLAFFQGMSHSEIAHVTQLPLGTVKTRLRAGLQKLRELWLEAVN
jgi:RNA polymerase sigma-70 factor, ECF subfamily